MSIYEKIYNVMCDTEAISKDMQVGTGQNAYKAVSEKEMLNLVKPLLKKHKLVIFPFDGQAKENTQVYEKTDYKGNVGTTLRAITELKVNYRIVDVETGESIETVGFGNGADSQDKGAGKAFTYSFKSMLAKTFMIFSGEDTDNDHSDDIDQANTTNHAKAPQTPAPKASRAIPGTFSDEEMEMLAKLLKATGTDVTAYCNKYNITDFRELTSAQYRMSRNNLEEYCIKNNIKV